MIIDIIDSFTTMDEPKLPDIFDGQELTKTQKLSEELQQVASNIVQICKIKVNNNGEDMDLAMLKEVSKITIDVQRAFFDNKQTNVQVNNNIQQISNTQLNHFRGLLRDEI